MSKKLLLRIAIAVPLLLVTCDSADAANRRALRRAARKAHYLRCYPVQPVCQPGTQPANANSSGKREPEFAFPDICPNTPVIQELDGSWVWYAERHYGIGRNCFNCFIEPTSLVGFYDVYSFNWPYPCGHEMCEPGYHAKPQRDYSGQKKGRVVDFDFNPIEDIPDHYQPHVREASPRRYFSFTDHSPTAETHYIIAYHIKTPRSEFTFGHEVDRSVLEGRGVTIQQLTDKQVKPIVYNDGVKSYVYQYKEPGDVRKPDPKTSAIFFLKK